MPYELQVKAVERRFDRNKFDLSFLKNAIAIGTTVVPTFLSGVSSIPISSIGYAGYLSKLFFEFFENDQLRRQVTDHRIEVRFLLNWYNSPYGHLGAAAGVNDQIIIAPSGNVDLNNYLLCNPMTASASMFGYVENPGINYTRHGAFDPRTLTFWITFIQLLLTSAAFATAIAQKISDPDGDNNNLSNPLVLISIICGAIASVIDPIEEHLKKGNLIRAKDTHLDVIYTIRGGRLISLNVAAVPPAPVVAPAPTLNRAKQVVEGLAEFFFISSTSGRSNRTTETVMNQNITNPATGAVTNYHPGSIKVSPNRYRYFQPGIHRHHPAAAPPLHITEIAVVAPPVAALAVGLGGGPVAPPPIRGIGQSLT